MPVELDYASLATDRVENCNLCGGQSFTVIAQRERFGLPATSVMCDACGLIFINPRMSGEAYGEFYASGQYRRISAQLQGVDDDKCYSRLVEGQTLYAESVARLLRKRLEPYRGGTLLDIGGSTGIVASKLCGQFGLTGTVLDPATGELDEAETRGLNCVLGTVETWDTSRTFDVIGIFQSIDHFLDIAGALRKVRRLLNPGGLFIVDIVEVRTTIRMFGVEGAMKVDHPFGLSDSAMKSFLLRAGFQIVGMTPSRDGRKMLYLCSPGEPVLAIPGREAVEEMRGLLQ